MLNFRTSPGRIRDGTVDVHFPNLEYDLTSAIKKAVYGFQSVDTLLASLSSPVKLTLYATTSSLPVSLADVPETIRTVAEDMAAKSGGKFTFEVVDPDVAGATVTRQQILDTYKLCPIAASLFSDQSYYLDMIMETTDAATGEPSEGSAGDEVTEASVRTAIESALKHLRPASQVIGLWTPPQTPRRICSARPRPRCALAAGPPATQPDYKVQTVTSTGQVPPEVNVLVIISPQGLDDRARFAIDQYLMRGGSVVVAAGNYSLSYDQFTGGLALAPVENGLADMLAHYGITVEQSLVMDPQNEPFPVEVDRSVGGTVVRELQAIDYPFFVDIRTDGMDKTHPIVSQLNAVTLNWASPVKLDETKNAGRETSVLLKSTANAWLRTDTNIQPDLQQYPDIGFAVEGERASQPLAVAVRGSFESYFKDKPSPLAQPAETAATAEGTPTPTPAPQTSGVVESSPDTARLVVIGSSDFLTDVVFQISASMAPNRYLNSLSFLQNAVDWSVEDLDLLGIRARGQVTRVLDPLQPGQERLWEVANYGLALAALVGLGVMWNVRRRNERPIIPEPGKEAA